MDKEKKNAYQRAWAKTKTGQASIKRTEADPKRVAKKLAWRTSTAGQHCIRQGHLLRTVGITLAEKEALFISQGSRCVCGSLVAGGRWGWHTDHDHITGKVRGVLCQSCNVLLGLAKDDPARLRLLANYVEKHI